MKNKLTIILGMVLLVGLVTAAGTITNVNPIDLGVIQGFIAGGTTSTTFSFDYPGNLANDYNDAPLVARINIESLISEYPVWKDDFQLNMVAEQYWLPFVFGNSFPINTIPMQCSETAPIKFKPKDKPGWLYTIDQVPDGTFYCYNPNYYMMQLDSHDEITLSITSDPALYPGEYEIEIELMEMELDTSPPEIEFLIEGYVYDEITPIPMKFNVTDMYEIQTVQYKITNPLLSVDNYYDSGWITTTFNVTSGLYEDYFDTSEYGLMGSGKYWIRAYACDVLGNCREM